MVPDILKIPNLISVGRLLLLIPAGVFLTRPGPEASLYALACLIVAGFSDFFDGFFARKLNQQTRLGLILDPVSDKIMAATVAILLILYRDFPLWLAGVIIGRDLIILMASLLVKSRLNTIPSSSLTGKYSFASIAVLLASYVIGFNFGITLFTFFALVFIALSLIVYGRGLLRVLKGKTIPKFADRPLYKGIRIILSSGVTIVFFYKLFQFAGWL